MKQPVLFCQPPYLWLQEMLSSRNISTHKGIPLYQYQLSETEYKQLKKILINQIHFRAKKEYWNAAFCLFCAEWFRREYKGGWSWKPIWEALDLELAPSERKLVVNSGLKDFWGLKVINYADERSSYLGSVLRQGGLPYQLLRSQASRFLDIFKRILQDFDAAKLMGKSTHELVRIHLDELPEAFTQATTVDLVTEMILRLINLVDLYALDTKPEPAKELAQLEPRWYENFPLPLDDSTSKQFLDGLLTSASQERTREKRKKDQVSCSHVLVYGDQIKFRCLIETPKEIPVKVEIKDLNTARVEVLVTEGDKVIDNLGIGIIQLRKDDNAHIRLRKRATTFLRLYPQLPLYLSVRQAGRELVALPIPESLIAIGDIPVGLKKHNDDWKIVGQASFSHRTSLLLIILPEAAEIDSTNANIERTEYINGLIKIEFSGKIDLNINNDRYHISSLENIHFSETVEVTGKTLPYKSKSGQPIYLGMPKLLCHQAGAQLWVGGEVHREGNTNSSGLQTVKLKTAKGITIFHKRLNILPDDMKVILKTGESANQGSIEILSRNNFSVSLSENQPDLSCKMLRMDNGKRFDLIAKDIPPTTLYFSILSNLEASAIVLSIPFPSKGAQVFSATGKYLDRQITISSLLGSRIIFYPNIGRPARYTVELRPSQGMNTANYFWQYTVKEIPLEIGLYDLKDYVRKLFTITPNLDSRVKLIIQGDGHTQVFEIMRYDCYLESTAHGITLSGDGIKRASDAKPVIMTLSDPKASPRGLVARHTQGTKTGYFEYKSHTSEPCLIVPEKESAMSFRAKFLPPINQINNSSKVTTLEKSVVLFHPEKSPQAFDPVFKQMETDFTHSGWRYLIVLFEKYSYLPLSTFEVWRAVVKHKKILCLIAYRFENPSIIMDRLEQSFNLFWELLPLKYWQASYNLYSSYLETLNLPSSVVSSLISDKLTQLSALTPVYNQETVNLVTQKLPEKKLLPKQVMSAVIQEKWYQNLMHIHRDNDWPDYHADELEHFYQELIDSPIEIDINSKFHRSVLLLPIFFASVASGKCSQDNVIQDTPINRFLNRKVIEFDRTWFDPVYHFCLSYFASKD